MTRRVKTILLAIGVLALAIQLYRPDRTPPPTDPSLALEASTPLPEEVSQVLARSCYDCHSHKTRWPWYSQVAPISWLVANDVAEGRGHLNFSIWNSYPRDRAAGKLAGIVEEVESGGMPMPIYTLMHRDAKLSPEAATLLVSWARAQQRLLQQPPGTQPR